MLAEKQKISVEDVVVFGTMIVEYFQYAAIGPDAYDFSYVISLTNSAVSFRIDKIFAILKDEYWVQFVIAFAAVGVYLILCILKITKWDRCVCKWFCLEYWVDLLLPAWSNLLFIPIINTLMDAFLCYQSTSDSLTDSFMNRNCYKQCWTGDHLGYVIGSSIALILYIPMAVFTRPLWQEMESSAHVKFQPQALMAKSIVQVILTTSANTLKQFHPSVHFAVYVGVLTLYVAYQCIFPQFNYHRANLWQVLITISILFLAIVSFVVTSVGYLEICQASFFVACGLLCVTRPDHPALC